jgi:D-beta-D-heptose 7-phosphate kinase/D-beta-D-heptose 1-phosphate adenosyltransferase
VKRRLVAEDQLLVRFDEGGPLALAPPTRAQVLRRLEELIPAVDAVLVSDYGYGLLDDVVVARLGELRARHPAQVWLVDAHDIDRFAALRPTAVTPSFAEVAHLLAPTARTAAGPERGAAVLDACADLHAATGARVVAVTLDRDGTVTCEQGRPPYRTWTRPAPHSRACGAGDSHAAALALALAAGATTPEAAELAQAASAVVTARDGTTTCSADDLRAQLLATTAPLEDPAAVAAAVAFHRRQGRRVVFTNGCFDLLHRGHVDLLNRAKALGDVLVVGLNSDAGVRRLKGPQRPLNPAEDRAQVLAALSCVDHLVLFDEPTATALVELLRPDVYVKGGDYTTAMVPEAPHVEAYGGQVLILPYVEDRSTTALVERIRAGAGAPAGGAADLVARGAEAVEP